VNRRVKNEQKMDYQGRQNNYSSCLNISKHYVENSSRDSTGLSVKK